METISRVVVIGGGELGKAVGVLLKKNNVTADLWDADPSVVPGQKALQEIVPVAECVAFCVPSWAMRVAVTGILPYLSPTAIVMSFAKGIEKDSRQTMAEMVPTILPPGTPFVVVGGPMLAGEITGGMAAIGVFASKDAAALQAAKALFASESFNVETVADPESVALAGVLKNIYAVALGIADGLTLSGNEKGWIAACAIREMRGDRGGAWRRSGCGAWHCGRGRFYRYGVQCAFAQSRNGDRDRCHGQVQRPRRGIELTAIPYGALGKRKNGGVSIAYVDKHHGDRVPASAAGVRGIFQSELRPQRDLNAAALVP